MARSEWSLPDSEPKPTLHENNRAQIPLSETDPEVPVCAHSKIWRYRSRPVDLRCAADGSTSFEGI